MKTERRHDLETNDLAVRITDGIEKLKPYSGHLVGVALALVALMVAGSWWNSYSNSKQKEAWDAFSVAYDTTDPELVSLRRVADQSEYAGTAMQEWAYITWADRQVLLASSSYLIDREAALDRLRQVEGVYEQLMSGAVDPQIQNRARFGLARVYEMQNKLDEARRNYSLVQGDLQPIASERAMQLESAEVQEACNWLASAELPKRDLTGAAGTPGERPNFEADLPTATPDASAPDMRSLEEILGAAGEDAAGEDRYSTEDSEEIASESDSPAEDRNDPADSESDVTEE